MTCNLSVYIFPKKTYPSNYFFAMCSSMCSLWVYSIGWNHSKYILLNLSPPSLRLIWSVNLVKFIFVFLLISSHNKAFIIFHLDYCSSFLTDFLATNPSSFPLPDWFFSIQSAHVISLLMSLSILKGLSFPTA